MSENMIQISYYGNTAEIFEQLAELILDVNVPAKLNQVKTKPKIADAIENNHCQLVISTEKDTGFDVFDVAQLSIELDKNIPIIGVHSGTKLSVGDAMNKGLSDFVALSDLQHLKQVIQRELNHALQTHKFLSSDKQSNKDFTGLSSRVQFRESLEKILPKRLTNKSEVAILYIQLDNFSWINESIDIAAGDTYLKSTAGLIDNILEETDFATRYQGGSFLVFVESSTLKKLREKTETIRQSIGESVIDITGVTISSTCSIGIRVVKSADEAIDTIISEAFNASETAKTNGGDDVHLYKHVEKVSADDKENHAWNKRIKDAFENDLFHLFYQPIVSLRGDTKPRYEVLLRMIDEDGNIIAPGKFLPFAERAGLMADIDRRVISNSFEKAQELKQAENATELFIKLSAKALDDKTMPGWISNNIKDFDVDHEDIVFEITESLALTHLPQTRRLVDSLKKLKCKVAIDHFGTCLKSLKLLEQIDVDYLKVDGSLVGNLSSNIAHQTIVKKVIKTANAKSIPVMAESVQDVNNLPVIWQYGFHFVQGYFLQIPDAQMEYDFGNLLI